jgi:hypothetical protein
MPMADEIPPFDLIAIMTNEYGHASLTSLYGIEVQDEGSVHSIDNLVTELVINYTAVAMDPIMAIDLDENGQVDPYGVLSGGYSKLWKHREVVIGGAAYSDMEQAYESQYDGIFAAYESRIARARQARQHQISQEDKSK